MSEQSKKTNGDWTRVIHARDKGLNLGLAALYQYRELAVLFMRRDLVAIYKQTVLGPFWLILQPLITSLAFMIVFGKLGGISTNGYPAFMFYYSGLVFWMLFAETFQKTADTFVANADLFSKVFFPRLVIPFSIALTSIAKFLMSLVVFMLIWSWYLIKGDLHLQHYLSFLWIPVLCVLTVLLGLSCGLLFSALTTRYRDFKFLLQFGIQILMYFSPVIFPLILVTGHLRTLILCNPMSGIIEASRSVFLSGTLPQGEALWISGGFTIILLFAGLFIFSKVQRNFIDTL